MERLYDRLQAYQRSDHYGFHMPGHKRQEVFAEGLPFGIDITEIDGFDDLHHPEGILLEAQKLAARVYGAEESRFLVNGSTAGILSAILGSTEKGDRILVARNCHKSVYHAICMNELKPVYLYPEFDESLHLNTTISVSAVKTALMEVSGIRAVVLVSPTYDGVISDVAAIARVVHEKGIPLIVDEAHGAHLGFHPYFPANALACGADVVIHSLHKTLPSLTQTALLHVQGTLADRGNIFRCLDMMQTSSPSYVLMASIDRCIHWLAEEATESFRDYAERLDRFRQEMKKLQRLQLLETGCYDRSKLVIADREQCVTGRELAQTLRERYHLQMEMAAGGYVIAMTSVCDTEEGFARLQAALFEMDKELMESNVTNRSRRLSGSLRSGKLPMNPQVQGCAEALRSPGEAVPWKASEGRVATEYAYLYPPGIPLVVPGEQVTAEVRDRVLAYEAAGYSIEGPEKDGYLRVQKTGKIAGDIVRYTGE